MLGALRPERHGGQTREKLVAAAVEDFLRVLPHGRQDYLDAVAGAALGLYRAAAGPHARFFVDKTPMYHQIADELVEAFPHGRVVFLWRNPLAVVASAVELFDGGRWEVNRYTQALFGSVEDLVAASRRHAAATHAVRFEDLVTGDAAPWRALTAFIGLEFDPAALGRFGDVQLQGRMGDPSGARAYGALTTEPLEKWRAALASPVRKAWCRRYLQWIGDDRLAHMGYDLADLLAQLDAIPTRRAGAVEDAGRLAASLVRDGVKLAVPAHTGDRSVWPRLAGAGRTAARGG